MNFQSRKFVLSDAKFLPYFIPRKLSKDSIFSVVISSLKKKNIELEVANLNVIDIQRTTFFLTTLENRFWIYQRTPCFEKQEFSFSFQTIDFSTKAFLFSKKRTNKEIGASLVSLLKEKEQFLKVPKQQKIFLKSRLLRLTRGGFMSSCFGNSAYVIKSSYFYRFRKQISYRDWFSLNISSYGLLTFFYLINYEKRSLPYSKKYQKKLLSKWVKFYYFKNKILNVFFLLGKPKDIQLQAF